jgi:hypothetical protein
MSAWDDAFSLVPFIHLPVVQGQRVLAVGPAAKSLAMTALRYPTTVEVVTIGIPAMPTTDPRVRSLSSLLDLPIGWRADLVGVAEQVISDRMLESLHQLHNSDTGVLVAASPSPVAVRRLKDMLRAQWSTIQPYREWTGDAVPSWFFLAADHGFKRHRPVPSWTVRLSEKYLPALFTLSKDEYAVAYGGNP